MVEISPSEALIRKQSLALARKVLKAGPAQGSSWTFLVCGLFRRSIAQVWGGDTPEQARALYTFLLKNDVEEKQAWKCAGMDEVLRGS